tara:strand:+ start:198 stop:434 length:237 start_codon:yes stop_codon:yes gene_type:complete
MKRAEAYFWTSHLVEDKFDKINYVVKCPANSIRKLIILCHFAIFACCAVHVLFRASKSGEIKPSPALFECPGILSVEP